MGRYLLFVAALLYSCGRVNPIPPAQAAIPPPQPTFQECLVATATHEVGTQETGWNAGARIVEYQSSTNAAKGTPYCASGVHWTFRRCGRVIEPHWEFAAAKRWAKEHEVFHKGQLDQFQDASLGHQFQRISMDADVFTLYYAKLGRVGHVGFIVGEEEEYLITVEFNTGPGGSREGEGVYKRKRRKDAVHSVNRWW